jgi:hyperosmotically inducible protein
MIKRATLFLSAVLMATATLAQAQTDPTLTADVKAKLAADDTVKGSRVTVRTADHVVTLEGTVRSEAVRTRALAIARDTPGVTSVVDKLTVSPNATHKAADKVERGADKSADAVGTAAHKTAGALDKTKDKTATAAEKTGEAVGTAAKKTGKALGTAADKTAHAVGVGADKTKEATKTAASKTKDATTKAGEKTADKVGTSGNATSDAAITGAVKARLLGDGKTPGLKVDVDTENGVVTLSGTVANASERTRAVELARDTKGVKDVVDKLTVIAK